MLDTTRDIVVDPDARSEEWVTRISGVWQQAVASILETGRLLTEAKAELAHGSFGTMIESRLPFGASTAQRLMIISGDPRMLRNVQHLPPHWGTLYELTKLNDDEFNAGIESRAIHPELERKALINGARSLMGSRVEPTGSLDYFPTPPWATRALLECVLLPHLGGEPLRSAWEPACGEGHIAEVLAEYFKSVTSTDIKPDGYGYGAGGQDFLDAETDFYADWIITNPPFGDLTERFVALALQRAKIGVAMFVRLQWLEGVGRYERIYRDSPPTIVALFAERVPLCKGCYDPNGDTATAYIWLVWIKDTEPRCPVWIPPGQREALTKPDDAERFTTHPVTRRKP